MAPHVLHWCTHGQGRWRGHHWQWSRPRLDQYQPMYPCSGCLQCSDGCRRRCRRRSSEHAVDVRHLRTGHGSMIQLNSNTQHHPLSVAIELEHAPVAHSQMVDAFCKNERFSTFSVGFYSRLRATSHELLPVTSAPLVVCYTLT